MNPNVAPLLKTLTPAESLLLMDFYTVKRKKLVQLTILDLLYKKVLKLTVNSPAEESMVWIELGRSLGGYSSKKHEKVIIKPLEDQVGNRLLFRDYIKIIVERSWPDTYFKFEVVACTAELAPFFRQSGLNKWFQIHGLNRQGKVQSQILEKSMQAYLKTHQLDAKQFETHLLHQFPRTRSADWQESPNHEIRLKLKGKFNSIQRYVISFTDAREGLVSESGEIDSHVNFERTGVA